MKFISYVCEFVCKINEIQILIIKKLNREIPGFFKIFRDISRPQIEPGSRELSPNLDLTSLTRYDRRSEHKFFFRPMANKQYAKYSKLNI